MSWVSDLVSATGLPVGAATLAVAMYAACTAAEKAARPDALKDIARVLKGASWSRPDQPATIIQRIFVLTFGERQLSLKCILRSFMASLLVYLIMVSILLLEGRQIRELDFSLKSILNIVFLAGVFLFGIVPDYIALAKARLFLRIHRRYQRLGLSFVLVIADISASLAISIFPFLFLLFLVNNEEPPRVLMEATSEFRSFWHDSSVFFYPVLATSTLFTSVWIILILLSTAALKLLSPVRRFTDWFFDVDKHPIQSIGVVAGALVMVISGILAILRVVL